MLDGRNSAFTAVVAAPSAAPPPSQDIMLAAVGDPHLRGFDGKWAKTVGKAGAAYTLLSDGTGFRVGIQLGAGGPKGKSAFIRQLHFKLGNATASASLALTGRAWKVTVAAGGKAMKPSAVVHLPSGVTVKVRHLLTLHFGGSAS